MYIIKFFKYLIEAIFIYTFFIIIKIIGLKLSRKLFSYIFIKLGPLFKSKLIIEENLNKALRDKNLKKKQIISKMWSNYGKVFVEYIYLNKFKKNNNHIKIKGNDILEKLVKDNKPVIFISGHFANFELMSMELTKAGVNLATIYRPLNNFFLNPFMEYMRKKYICNNQIKKGITGIRHTIEFLKNNCSIALMVDQRVSEGKSLPFFKYNALTTTLPAHLALKFHCNIVPIYIRRNEKDIFEIEFLNPINILNKENNDVNKIEISLKLNEILEEMILRDPTQWIWTHNRWK